MIKVYLAGISSQYEGEDIEVRYCIYEDQEFVCKTSTMLEYKKPAIVGQVALMTILKELEKDKEKEIMIVINDPALYEVTKGTSTTKNKDVLIMARGTKKELSKFEQLTICDVYGNRKELMQWNEMLQS